MVNASLCIVFISCTSSFVRIISVGKRKPYRKGRRMKWYKGPKKTLKKISAVHSSTSVGVPVAPVSSKTEKTTSPPLLPPPGPAPPQIS